MLFAPVEDFQQVISELGRDGAVDFANGVVEYNLVEFGNHSAFLELSQISTRRAGRALRVLGGKCCEVSAVLDLRL